MALQEADGHTWADLISVANPSFVVPKYGRGDDQASAAVSAMARWRVEQAT
jgi:hypothetical protein